MKIGQKTEKWIPRYYVIRDNSILVYNSRNDRTPMSKFLDKRQKAQFRQNFKLKL